MSLFINYEDSNIKNKRVLANINNGITTDTHEILVVFSGIPYQIESMKQFLCGRRIISSNYNIFP